MTNERDRFRAELIFLYRFYKIEKTEQDVDMLLEKCKGKEETLIDKVRKKYSSRQHNGGWCYVLKHLGSARKLVTTSPDSNLWVEFGTRSRKIFMEWQRLLVDYAKFKQVVKDTIIH